MSIKQHIEKIEGKDELITDQAQSVVTIRPKHYIGSSGSVWASDYMCLYHELTEPKLTIALTFRDLLFILMMSCFTSLTLP